MSIAASLLTLSDTKTAIKAAIIAKGVTVSDLDAFSAYPAKIASISVGGGTPEMFGDVTLSVLLPSTPTFTTAVAAI